MIEACTVCVHTAINLYSIRRLTHNCSTEEIYFIESRILPFCVILTRPGGGGSTAENCRVILGGSYCTDASLSPISSAALILSLAKRTKSILVFHSLQHLWGIWNLGKNPKSCYNFREMQVLHLCNVSI